MRSFDALLPHFVRTSSFLGVAYLEGVSDFGGLKLSNSVGLSLTLYKTLVPLSRAYMYLNQNLAAKTLN